MKSLIILMLSVTPALALRVPVSHRHHQEKEKSHCPQGCPKGMICALEDTICGIGEVYQCEWPCKQDEDCDFLIKDETGKACVEAARRKAPNSCQCAAGTIFPRCLNRDIEHPTAHKICDQKTVFQDYGLPSCI